MSERPSGEAAPSGTSVPTTERTEVTSPAQSQNPGSSRSVSIGAVQSSTCQPRARSAPAMKSSAASSWPRRLGMRVKSVRKRVWRSNPSATAEMMASRSDGSSGERVMSECPDGSARDTSRDQRGQSRAWGEKKSGGAREEERHRRFFLRAAQGGGEGLSQSVRVRRPGVLMAAAQGGGEGRRRSQVPQGGGEKHLNSILSSTADP